MRVRQRELDRGWVVADQFLNPSLYLAIQRHAGRKLGGFDIVHIEKMLRAKVSWTGPRTWPQFGADFKERTPPKVIMS